MERAVEAGLEEKGSALTQVILLGETGFDWSFNCGGCCVGCGSSELLKRVVGESLHEQRKEHWITMMLGGAALGAVCLVPGFGQAIGCHRDGCCGHDTGEAEGEEEQGVEVEVHGATPEILNSEIASTTGIRAVFESVRGLESAFMRAKSAADLAIVATMCQETLAATADAVVRLYPDDLKGIDTRSPAVAIHILDTFFGSRIGTNLDEPSRKMVRSILVLTYDIQASGFRDRTQATVSVESVRFIVATFLLLV